MNHINTLLIISLAIFMGLTAFSEEQRTFSDTSIGDVKFSLLNPEQFKEENGENWVLMRGQSFDSDELKEYNPKLKTYLGENHLPDGRGKFFRGMDVNSNNDPDPVDREVGYHVQHYSTAFPNNPFTARTTEKSGPHTHQLEDYVHFESGLVIESGFPREDWESYAENGGGKLVRYNNKKTTEINSQHTHENIIISGGDPETRPTNIALYVYLKVK